MKETKEEKLKRLIKDCNHTIRIFESQIEMNQKSIKSTNKLKQKYLDELNELKNGNKND
ncbi:MAG: hypothetical protein ACOC33_02805 [bacterium]